jgi:uncharacterized protein YdaL
LFHLRRNRLRLAAVAAALLAVPVVASAAHGASAAPAAQVTAAKAAAHVKGDDQDLDDLNGAQLPPPPKPPSGRPVRSGFQPHAVSVSAAVRAARAARAAGKAGAAAKAGTDAVSATLASSSSSSAAASAAAPAVTPPPQAKTWGGSGGSATALVLYDTTGTWGWLGELYAIGAGNLASHFGSVTAEPVVDYVAGQANDYTAVIYLGSTYNEPLPASFVSDVQSTSTPVIWAGDNVWQLTGTEGSAADTAFKAAYGWDPSNSYFDSTDDPVTVTYKGETFTRSASAGPEVLAPDITSSSLVTVLAQANCTNSSGAATNCAPIAQSTGTSFPWAIRSGNITYVGEIPFSYMNETDRYVAFSDLLFPALDPTAAPSHVALVRLEDVNATSDASEINAITTYLHSQGVPFSINVIPEYTDPNGYYNSGTPQTETIGQSSSMVAALKNAIANGASLNEEGYTHQYSNVANPYDGVSGDDAEFYLAQCTTTQSPPYTVVAPCQNTDYVTWEGPVPGDSQAWALSRVQAGQALFTAAGLPAPKVWVTPHYFASAADYAAIDSVIPVRYERDVFPGGLLTGGTLDYSHIFGQFFPYEVTDAYGERIVPENLGDDEPTEVNNNPPRTPADIIANAKVNLAVTQGTASFFFDPSLPLTDLETIVAGIKALGYTFVGPTGLPS